MKRILASVLIIATVILTGCTNQKKAQETPSGMSAVETIEYLYEKMNEKDVEAVLSVYEDQYIERTLLDRDLGANLDDIISVELIGCEEETDSEFIKSLYDNEWYPDPYAIAIVWVEYDVKHVNGVGADGYDGVIPFGHTLVKADENSDWKIFMNGLV